MLNLPNLKIEDMKEFQADYRFLVKSTASPPSDCPKCATVTNLSKHSKQEQLFYGLPMHATGVG